MQVDKIYNYLSTSIIPKKRNTTHKTSELREVYSKMASNNKSSPLYLLSLSESKQSFMVNLKEAALTLQDVVSEFGNEKSIVGAKKVFNSDNPDSISGEIKGSLKDLPDNLELKLDKLATTQINKSSPLDSSSYIGKEGALRFSMSQPTGITNFSIPIESDDTELDIGQKIVRAFSSKDYGVTASLKSDETNSYLKFESADTGRTSREDGLIFSFMSSEDNELFERLGMNTVNQAPSNASFYINDTYHESSSNHISINQSVELDFHKVSDTPVNISFAPDMHGYEQELNNFIGAYNTLLNLSKTAAPTTPGTRNLATDVSSILRGNKASLEKIGINIEEDNSLVADTAKVSKSLKDGSVHELFTNDDFKESIAKSTSKLVIDPVAYVNKLIVTYPNTNQTKFGTPYTESIYSGLMYNNYS